MHVLVVVGGVHIEFERVVAVARPVRLVIDLVGLLHFRTLSRLFQCKGVPKAPQGAPPNPKAP